jgi:hypothetical protein
MHIIAGRVSAAKTILWSEFSAGVCPSQSRSWISSSWRGIAQMEISTQSPTEQKVCAARHHAVQGKGLPPHLPVPVQLDRIVRKLRAGHDHGNTTAVELHNKKELLQHAANGSVAQ